MNCSRDNRVVVLLRHLAFLTTLGVGFAQAQPESPRWSVKKLVEVHQKQHPVFTVQDVVKMFYQASFGVEHILSDTAGVVSYLMNELESVESDSQTEPLLERISLDGETVRINLRPFKALNLDPQSLVKVMFQSAGETTPDTVMFHRQWIEFTALVRFGMLRFPPDEVGMWDERVRGGEAKPVHHSVAYRDANRPAYRVVKRSVVEATFGKIGE